MIEIVFPRHELSVMKRLAGDRMMFFFERLRDLSAGKPVGIRLFNPGREVIDRLCKSMRETQVHLDFITIDGTALSGSDSFGGGSASNASFFGSLTGARRALNDYGLPTKIMVSENIVSEYEILRSVALGASACYCTAPMVLAANSGSGLAIPNAVGRRLRVANFHRNTVHATLSLMKLCGYDTLEDVNPDDFCRKTSRFEIQTLKEIYFDNSPKNEPHRFSHLS